MNIEEILDANDHEITPERIRSLKRYSHLTDDQTMEIIRSLERLSEIIVKHAFEKEGRISSINSDDDLN